MSDLQLQAIAAGIIRCRDATIRNDSAGIPKESHHFSVGSMSNTHLREPVYGKLKHSPKKLDKKRKIRDNKY